MSRAGRSLFIFGICAMLLGAILVAVPNMVFNVFGVPRTSEVWIRVAGVLGLVIGFYEMQAGRKNLVEFLRWSVIARSSFIVFLALFVLFGLAKPILILFGVMDLAGAAWTFVALRSAK